MKKETQGKTQFKSKNSKKIRICIAITLLIAVIISTSVCGFIIKDNIDKQKKAQALEIKKQEKENKKLIADITEHYDKTVYTIDETDLYIKEKNKFQKDGKIGKNVKITLEEIKEITIDNEYFKITSIDGEYYIHYSNVTKENTTNESSKMHGMASLSKRYKHYIPFNENVITNDKYSLYDTSDNLLYEIKGSLNKPILIKKSDKYYFEYNDTLVYVKKEDTKKIEEHKNTDETPTDNMPVLLYHFFYDENSSEDIANCGGQIICVSNQEFSNHLDYLKNNGFFTPNMDEFEMFIDGELRLNDKTALITIDDGWLGGGGVSELEKHELNGTIFIISSAYEARWLTNDYVEAHSHSYNMHQNWQCPTSSSAIGSQSQGGALLCWDEQAILEDLKKSRELTNNTHVFCYPFFDYNDRAIEILKKAGFTMGFIGGMQNARVGQDKMLIPRQSVLSGSGVDTVASIVN